MPHCSIDLQAYSCNLQELPVPHRRSIWCAWPSFTKGAKPLELGQPLARMFQRATSMRNSMTSHAPLPHANQRPGMRVGVDNAGSHLVQDASGKPMRMRRSSRRSRREQYPARRRTKPVGGTYCIAPPQCCHRILNRSARFRILNSSAALPTLRKWSLTAFVNNVTITSTMSSGRLLNDLAAMPSRTAAPTKLRGSDLPWIQLNDTNSYGKTPSYGLDPASSCDREHAASQVALVWYNGRTPKRRRRDARFEKAAGCNLQGAGRCGDERGAQALSPRRRRCICEQRRAETLQKPSKSHETRRQQAFELNVMTACGSRSITPAMRKKNGRVVFISTSRRADSRGIHPVGAMKAAVIATARGIARPC